MRFFDKEYKNSSSDDDRFSLSDLMPSPEASEGGESTDDWEPTDKEGYTADIDEEDPKEAKWFCMLPE